MIKMQITLDPDEATVLAEWAAAELRDPREQIHFLLRQELERRGMLTVSGEAKGSFPSQQALIGPAG